MNGSTRARHTPSIANSTKIFGIMGGLGGGIGIGVANIGIYRHIIIKSGQGLPELRGLTPAQQYAQLKKRGLLSVNPLGSGGVGKRTLMF